MASTGPGQGTGPPGRRTQPKGTPPLQTSSQQTPDVRYSFTDTPMEMQRPSYNHPLSSPTNSTIDESPISPASTSRFPPSYSEGEHPPPVSAEKSQVQSPQDVHPAFFAPYRDHTTPQQPQHVRRVEQSDSPTKAPLSPYATSGPVVLTSLGGTNSSPPIPAVQSPLSQSSQHNFKPNIEPDTNFPAPPPNQSNTDPSSHRPGQVAHSKSTSSREWKHGLCEPSPVCCTAVFCPCIVYGKTMYRLSQKMAKQDPTDLLGYETCNGACGLMALACGFQWALAWIQRMRIRKIYDIEGGVGGDCVESFYCFCCVLARDEREIRDREDLMRRREGPSSGTYVSHGGMAYAPPPR